MNEEEKKAIEYLKTRLHGNEGCKYIDVSQDDLRIFINLVDEQIKDNEGWKKYCEEIEEEQTEMSNKNYELEFEVEKLQKENEELKGTLRDTQNSWFEDTKKMEKLKRDFNKSNNIAIKNMTEYVSKKEIKDQIEHYQELQNNYIEKYDEISENIQSIINVLQVLLEEGGNK